MTLTLSQLVKKRRGQLALSMAQVSQSSKGAVSTVTVHDIEKGRSVDLRASMILGLAKALKVKPEVILGAIQNSLKEPADG